MIAKDEAMRWAFGKGKGVIAGMGVGQLRSGWGQETAGKKLVSNQDVGGARIVVQYSSPLEGT